MEKKSTSRRPVTRARATVRGETVGGYVCGVRGQAVPSDETCGCAQFCDVDCSGMAMSTRKATMKSIPVRMVGDI